MKNEETKFGGLRESQWRMKNEEWRMKNGE